MSNWYIIVKWNVYMHGYVVYAMLIKRNLKILHLMRWIKTRSNDCDTEHRRLSQSVRRALHFVIFIWTYRTNTDFLSLNVKHIKKNIFLKINLHAVRFYPTCLYDNINIYAPYFWIEHFSDTEFIPLWVESDNLCYFYTRKSYLTICFM